LDNIRLKPVFGTATYKNPKADVAERKNMGSCFHRNDRGTGMTINNVCVEIIKRTMLL